jgi:demethylmenaquinone methyltransferase/2-methoxy-6-polyprenyl-1,4-benzoquinol methylase
MTNYMDIISDDKKTIVGSMFDSIAWRYDFLNHFLSFGIDRYWRRRAIRIISQTHNNPAMILDVATGTGDLAIAALKLNPWLITGIDISLKMLEEGREKVRRRGFSDRICLVEGDSESIGFRDNSFDVAMVAFGVRNFSDPVKGLLEMNRVLHPGGLVMILEFSKPAGLLFRQLFNFYFLRILPFIGKIFSKNSTAYRYLPESVLQFPDNEKFVDLVRKAGFTSVNQKKLTGGVASIYTGLKS